MILGVLEYIYYLAQYSIGDSGFGREPNIPINHYLYLNGI